MSSCLTAVFDLRVRRPAAREKKRWVAEGLESLEKQIYLQLKEKLRKLLAAEETRAITLVLEFQLRCEWYSIYNNALLIDDC